MTGRNRSDRLSDAQRSALWFMFRGGYAVAMPRDASGGAWFVDKARRGPGVRRSVVLALVGRGLVEKHNGVASPVPLYGLTQQGVEVARKVSDEIDPRGEGVQ